MFILYCTSATPEHCLTTYRHSQIMRITPSMLVY